MGINSHLLMVKIFYSTDSGKTWTTSNFQTSYFIKSLYMVKTNAIVATNKGLWYSTDGGATWLQYTDIYSDNYMNSVYMNGNNFIAGGVYAIASGCFTGECKKCSLINRIKNKLTNFNKLQISVILFLASFIITKILVKKTLEKKNKCCCN